MSRPNADLVLLTEKGWLKLQAARERLKKAKARIHELERRPLHPEESYQYRDLQKRFIAAERDRDTWAAKYEALNEWIDGGTKGPRPKR